MNINKFAGLTRYPLEPQLFRSPSSNGYWLLGNGVTTCTHGDASYRDQWYVLRYLPASGHIPINGSLERFLGNKACNSYE